MSNKHLSLDNFPFIIIVVNAKYENKIFKYNNCICKFCTIHFLFSYILLSLSFISDLLILLLIHFHVIKNIYVQKYHICTKIYMYIISITIRTCH